MANSLRNSNQVKKDSFHAEQDDYNKKLINQTIGLEKGEKPSLGLYKDSEGKIVEVLAFNVSCYDVKMRVSRTNVLICRNRLLPTKVFFTLPIGQFLAILPNNKKRYTKIPNDYKEGELQ